ncbi:hypothetical protein M422DRAFT_41156 [Sphaerobolus stellatus SS14]|nr:hypothetical protein M422DRAFT_41156 [Sphaerobolus stellatus SS14]
MSSDNPNTSETLCEALISKELTPTMTPIGANVEDPARYFLKKMLAKQELNGLGMLVGRKSSSGGYNLGVVLAGKQEKHPSLMMAQDNMGQQYWDYLELPTGLQVTLQATLATMSLIPPVAWIRAQVSQPVMTVHIEEIITSLEQLWDNQSPQIYDTMLYDQLVLEQCFFTCQQLNILDKLERRYTEACMTSNQIENLRDKVISQKFPCGHSELLIFSLCDSATSLLNILVEVITDLTNDGLDHYLAKCENSQALWNFSL